MSIPANNISPTECDLHYVFDFTFRKYASSEMIILYNTDVIAGINTHSHRFAVPKSTYSLDGYYNTRAHICLFYLGFGYSKYLTMRWFESRGGYDTTLPEFEIMYDRFTNKIDINSTNDMKTADYVDVTYRIYKRLF